MGITLLQKKLFYSGASSSHSSRVTVVLFSSAFCMTFHGFSLCFFPLKKHRILATLIFH